MLRPFDMDAAVLFDPLNVRYATGLPHTQVSMSHHLSRYAFVPVEGPVGRFDSPGIYYPQDAGTWGYSGIFEGGMTVCVESHIGPVGELAARA